MASVSEQPVTLLLLGRTGNGKSSTGNSVLGKKVFKTGGSCDSTSYKTSKENSNIRGKEVIVVDGPSIHDIDAENRVQQTKDFIDAMNETFMRYCSKKVSAFLIVLKYGVRYTRQEKEAITTIKHVFGSDVLKNHGVIVMTHGDSFEMDMEDEDFMNTFEHWCHEQGGDVKDLFEECNYRCVVLNNKSKDGAKLEEQFKTLMGKVDECEEYTEKEYQAAEIDRTKLTVLSKLPKLEEETRKLVDKITSSLNRISEAGDYGSDSTRQILTDLKKELGEHETHLKTEDKDTEITKRPMGEVKLIQMRLETIFKLMNLQRGEPPSPEEQMKLSMELSQIKEQEESSSNLVFWPYIWGLLVYLYVKAPVIKYLWPPVNSEGYTHDEAKYNMDDYVVIDPVENVSSSHENIVALDEEPVSRGYVKIEEKKKSNPDMPPGAGPST